MPRAEQLPADLQELAYRNAVELTHARWKSDVQVLIQALRPHMEASGEEVSPQRRHPPGAGLTKKAVVDATPPANAIGIEKAVLERVSRELAAYIGPIAEIVVKRAAKRSTSVTDLCAIVSQEIESSADRAKFLVLPALEQFHFWCINIAPDVAFPQESRTSLNSNVQNRSENALRQFHFWCLQSHRPRRGFSSRKAALR